MTANQEIVDKIKSLTSEAVHVVETASDATKLLKESNTSTYVYLLIADGEVIILGEGTNQRGYVIFPGRAAPAHLKAIPAALAHLVSNECTRLFIPSHSKSHSLEIEKALKDGLNFHHNSVDAKSDILLEKRVKQLNCQITEEVSYVFDNLLYATGTDIGTYKKIRDLKPDKYKKVSEEITKITGGYYTDL